MPDPTQEILIPKVLVLPINETEQAHAAIGTLMISGAKLYFAATKGSFELVTSA